MHTERERVWGGKGSNCRSVSYRFLFLPAVVASFDFDHDHVDFNHDYGSYAYSEMGTSVRELCFEGRCVSLFRRNISLGGSIRERILISSLHDILHPKFLLLRMDTATPSTTTTGVRRYS